MDVDMRILVVDDDRAARRTLTRVLESIGRLEIVEGGSLEEARAYLTGESFDVAFIDLKLSDDVEDRDGLLLVHQARQLGVLPIVVTGLNDMHEMRAAMRCGAYDLLLKEDLREELVAPLIDHILARRRLEKEVLELRSRHGEVSGPVGTSPAMQRLRELVERAALSDRPVLVTGPTGAGKELTVRAIHALGAHPHAPLLDVNCGAFPEALIESQLFGHEKGAFTGAERRHDGFFAAVGNGTLFLDEIGEMPLDLQAKLLRVLESRTFRPLGSNTAREFCGRVVAATHVDLDARVEQGQFRADLYYRLNVLELHVPSLEERREDIPALVSRFASEQERPLFFTAEAIAMLQEASWPGNVRQLRNLIDRLAVFAPDGPITPELIATLTGRRRTEREAHTAITELAREILRTDEPDKLERVEQVLIDEALRLCDDNKSKAARLLGVHRKVVERRLERVQQLTRWPRTSTRRPNSST
jgi:DNA-binding NtrC family response regulator